LRELDQRAFDRLQAKAETTDTFLLGPAIVSGGVSLSVPTGCIQQFAHLLLNEEVLVADPAEETVERYATLFGRLAPKARIFTFASMRQIGNALG
jgi:hypothetical protein